MKSHFLFGTILLTAGCAFLKPVKEETRYHLLAPALRAAAAGHPATDSQPRLVRLQPIDLAEYLQGRDIAILTGANQLTYPENDRWAEPLDAGIRRVLAEDLRASPGISEVLTDQPVPPGQHVYTIYIHVLACDGVIDSARSSSISFIATWTINGNGPQNTVAGHGVFRAPPTPWTAGAYNQLAALISNAVRDLSNEMLTTITNNSKAPR